MSRLPSCPHYRSPDYRAKTVVAFDSIFNFPGYRFFSLSVVDRFTRAGRNADESVIDIGCLAYNLKQEIKVGVRNDSLILLNSDCTWNIRKAVIEVTAYDLLTNLSRASAYGGCILKCFFICTWFQATVENPLFVVLYGTALRCVLWFGDTIQARARCVVCQYCRIAAQRQTLNMNDRI